MSAAWHWEQDANALLRLEGDVGSIVRADGSIVCDFGDDTQYYPSAGNPPEPEDLATILAAPVMFTAIKQFEAWWQEVGQVSFNGAPACVFALREAAAKARGGA